MLRKTEGGKHWQMISRRLRETGRSPCSDAKKCQHLGTQRKTKQKHRETYQNLQGGKAWEKKTAD